MAEKDLRSTYIEYPRLWEGMKKYRKLYYIILSIAFVSLCIYYSGVSDYYVCTVKLSPEFDKDSKGASFASIASMLGFRFGNNKQNEALFPTLYPELMESVDFKRDVMNVKVHKENEKTSYTYYDYLINHQKAPWWSPLFGEQQYVKPDTIDAFRLTLDQDFMFKSMKNVIICNVDKAYYVITLSVVDQDPFVCALMTDSVVQILQRYITNYHINKARIDYEHQETVYERARGNYQTALNAYAEYSDSNRDAISQQVVSKKKELEDNIDNLYRIYTKVSEDYNEARNKLQKEKPAFVFIQSPTVPVESAGPFRIYSIVTSILTIWFLITLFVFFRVGCWKRLFGIIEIQD